ncbi:MAG: hypothetical protein QM536_03700 [Chitinophagaceae bacterium]|nr:hypothetical protein [Chitinophagaceae bacterium]
MHLLDIIKNSYQVEQKNIKEIQDLIDKYPYFQTGYILHFIFSYNNITESEKKKLEQKINVFITDKVYVNRTIEKYTINKMEKHKIVDNTISRTNNESLSQNNTNLAIENKKESPSKKGTYSLKKILETMNNEHQNEPDTYKHLYKFKDDNKPNTINEKNTKIPKSEVEKNSFTIETNPIEQDNLIKEVMENLNKVHISKINYIKYMQTKNKEIPQQIIDNKELHNDINDLLDNIKKETFTEVTKKSDTIQEIDIQNIISDVQSISYENSDTSLTKDKKQNKKQLEKEIIENFINTNPKINVRTTSENTDHTNFLIESTVIEENVYNETLAKIFLKQGKKDKCIEIYKKLMIKHPYQKQYFEQKIKEIELTSP